MKRMPTNWIERFLVEDCRNLTWLSKKTGIAYSTLHHKVAKRSDSELLNTLSYIEYITIENIAKETEQ